MDTGYLFPLSSYKSMLCLVLVAFMELTHSIGISLKRMNFWKNSFTFFFFFGLDFKYCNNFFKKQISCHWIYNAASGAGRHVDMWKG